MPESESRTNARECSRCGGTAMYWKTAIIPGDEFAPAGSNRAFAHAQPAWICLDCGHLEPHERRTRAHEDEHPIWRS